MNHEKRIAALEGPTEDDWFYDQWLNEGEDHEPGRQPACGRRFCPAAPPAPSVAKVVPQP